MNNLFKAFEDTLGDRFSAEIAVSEHDFSPEFEEKMSSLIAKIPSENGIKTSRSVGIMLRYLIIAAVVAMLTVSAVAVGPKIVKQFTRWLDNSHYFSYSKDSDGNVTKRSGIIMKTPENAENAASAGFIFNIRTYGQRDGEACHLETFDDPIRLTFGGGRPGENFILKLFLDCEETDFTVDGVTSDRYILTPGGGLTETELRLATDLSMDREHSLIAVIMSDENVENSGKTRGVAYRVRLTNDSCKPEIQQLPDDPEKYLDCKYQGIVVGKQFNVEENIVRIPPKKIKVSPGETVKLSLRTGCYPEEIDGVAVILMLNNEPVNIGGKDFLHISNDPGRLSYDTVELTAPTEPGSYRLSCLAVPDPFGNAGTGTCDFGFEIALTVE